MSASELNPGDVVYAATDLFNDGSIPGLEEGTLLAAAGARGVLLKVGHLEEEPDRTLYLVRFEDAGLNLGPPVGCWEEEIRSEAPQAVEADATQ